MKGVEVHEYKNEAHSSPLVSVIITTYNHILYIEKSIESIVNQKTDFAYEIIIGDDNSTDGTREKCILYAEKYPEKIRLFLHDGENKIFINGKPTGRFNFIYSLKKARGNYIALCEGDDYWINNLKLQKQIDFLEKNKNYAICFHNCLEKHLNSLNDYNYVTTNKNSFDISDLFIRNFMPSSSILFRNQFKTVSLPDWFKKAVVGDWTLNLINAQYGKIGYINEVMSVHLIHEGGVWSHNKEIENIKSILILYDLLKSEFPPAKIYLEKLSEGKSRLLLLLANELRKQNKFFKSFILLIKSIYLHPKKTLLSPRNYYYFYFK